jgi:hypothetical protein
MMKYSYGGSKAAGKTPMPKNPMPKMLTKGIGMAPGCSKKS